MFFSIVKILIFIYNTFEKKGGFMKTVLVTGSAKGLGAALIKEFARNNYNVIICYNTSETEALNLKKEITNVNVDIVKCDISNEREIINLFNNYKFEILINNSALSLDNNYLDKTKEEFMKVLEVNLVGTFLMCKEAIKKKVKEIINISSTDSIDTFGDLNIDYSCSKAGINIITNTLSKFNKDIRIIGILPNWINTESIMEMNQEYLKNELERINQEKLLDKDDVAKEIYNIYNDKNIESGSLIRIDYEGGLCIKVLE